MQVTTSAQTQQQHFLQGHIVDLQRQRIIYEEKNFIELIKGPIFIEIDLSIVAIQEL